MSGPFQLFSSKIPGRSGLGVLSASPSPRPHPASQPSSWGAGSLPTKAARVSTQSHRAMASSALLSIPHPAAGAVPRAGAPVLSPPARPAKKGWRWTARCSAGLRGAQGEGASAPASAAGSPAGAGSRGCAGCGTTPDSLQRASAVRAGRGNPTLHGLLAGVPGPSAEGEPVAETLERGGGALRGGARGQGFPHPVAGPAPPPGTPPGSPAPHAHSISLSHTWPESPDVSDATALFLAAIKGSR